MAATEWVMPALTGVGFVPWNDGSLHLRFEKGREHVVTEHFVKWIRDYAAPMLVQAGKEREAKDLLAALDALSFGTSSASTETETESKPKDT